MNNCPKISLSTGQRQSTSAICIRTKHMNFVCDCVERVVALLAAEQSPHHWSGFKLKVGVVLMAFLPGRKHHVFVTVLKHRQASAPCRPQMDRTETTRRLCHRQSVVKVGLLNVWFRCYPKAQANSMVPRHKLSVICNFIQTKNDS